MIGIGKNNEMVSPYRVNHCNRIPGCNVNGWCCCSHPEKDDLWQLFPGGALLLMGTCGGVVIRFQYFDDTPGVACRMRLLRWFGGEATLFLREVKE